jgi:hypothetical protein
MRVSNVRLYHLDETATVVDLGRVEILFFHGVPVLAVNHKTKEVQSVDPKKDGSLGVLIEGVLAPNDAMARKVATRDSLEKFIVLGMAEPYPHDRYARDARTPEGAKGEE